MTQYLKFVLWIGLLLALVMAPPLAAQEEDGPPQVGLRHDAPPYGEHGPHWVGVQQFPAETDFHPTTVAVWYPALNPQRADETITYSDYDSGVGEVVNWGGHALENAAPDLTGAPYPLVIFVHGYWMARFNNAYLTEHLASYGFAVMAIEYGDSATMRNGFDGDLSMYTRPMDVAWQIDYAEQLTDLEGVFQGLIDTDQVAVVGHSYGAYTALMAGGAQLDFRSPTSATTLYPNLTTFVESRPLVLLRDDIEKKLVDLAGLDTVPEALWPSWGDSRVDAIVPLAPDILPFSADSFRNISVPTMIQFGSIDSLSRADLPEHRAYLYDSLGSAQKALVIFDNADHSIFTDSCEAAPYLVEAELAWVCSDSVWDMDRAHDLINHYVTGFLLDVLKGDENAHRRVASDIVHIPGVTHEVEGY